MLNILAVSFFGFSSEMLTYNGRKENHWGQLISTHFSHHSWQHLSGNLTALPVLMALFPVKNRALILAFVVCILVTGTYAMITHVGMFLGFSALLYCIPGCYFVILYDQKNFTESGFIGLILLTYTLLVSTPESNLINDWHPMTAAHLVGFLSGLVAQLVCVNVAKPFKSTRNEKKVPHQSKLESH